MLVQFFDGVAHEENTKPTDRKLHGTDMAYVDADGGKLDTSETKALLEYFIGHTVGRKCSPFF